MYQKSLQDSSESTWLKNKKEVNFRKSYVFKGDSKMLRFQILTAFRYFTLPQNIILWKLGVKKALPMVISACSRKD